MKRIVLLLIGLMISFSACQQQNFTTADAKDIKNFTTWKEIDKPKNRFVLYKFNGNEYIEEYYATQNFDELVDTHDGNIIKTDGDRMLISKDDGGLYNCSICPSTDNESMTFSCKPQNGVGKESCTTLWRYNK